MSQTESLERGWTLDEVEQHLHELTVKQLTEHLLPTVKIFLQKERVWLSQQEQRVAKVAGLACQMAGGKVTKKADIAFLVSVPFLTPECFQRFRKHLTEEANTILETVVLDGPITSVTVDQRYGLESADKIRHNQGHNPRYFYQSKPALKLYFVYEPPYYGYRKPEKWVTFYWPYALRALALPLLFPEPPPLVFEAPPQNADTQVFQGEAMVQAELPGLAILLQQKSPKMSMRGRPAVTSVRSIGKKLNIQEFFPDTPDKRLAAIRVRCLVGLLTQSKQLSPSISPADIKSLFAKAFTQKFHPPLHLLTYFKRIDRIGHDWVQQQGDRYREVMNLLPQGQWVQYESLVRSLKVQSYALSPSMVEGINELYWEERVEAAYGSYYMESQRVHPNLSERLFLWPAFHAMTYTFAAWGLLDIAYRTDDQSPPAPNEVDSPLDRIVSIRLTALGAYVLGRTDTYQSTVKSPFVLELADDSLSILLVEGDQERAAAAIKSFARPLGQQRFYSNANLFLDDCKSAQELTEKIKLFKSIFTKDLPANWEAFFQEISQQVNPLQAAKGYSIFQLDPKNTALLQLIARDPELKAFSLKAEGYLLLVKNKELKKFKGRLQALGYLLE